MENEKILQRAVVYGKLGQPSIEYFFNKIIDNANLVPNQFQAIKDAFDEAVVMYDTELTDVYIEGYSSGYYDNESV